MKTTAKLFLTLFVCFSFSQFSFATKWRINNNSIQANFTQLHQAASSSNVLSGDTLYVEGTVFVYEDVNFYKRVVIIGNGYYLGENDSTQANVNASRVNNITFSNGSRGSVVTGMSVVNTLNILDSSIVIKRNNLNNIGINNCANTVFIDNCILMRLSCSNSMNSLISNNLFINADGYTQNITISSNSSATVMNNVFKGPQYYQNCILRNNIATGVNGTGNDGMAAVNTAMEHNIGAGTQYGSSNGNMENVYMSMVFANTGSTDGKFRLKTGSVAIGAGTGGVDCGAFGGDYPYVLSGLPEVPAIWYLNVVGTSVTVKAKSH